MQLLWILFIAAAFLQGAREQFQNTCCFVRIHTLSGQQLKSNGQESILFCWLMRTIDWAVWVQVLTFCFNLLITFPQSARFTKAVSAGQGTAVEKHLQKPTHTEHQRMELDDQWLHNWSTHLLLNIVGEVASSCTTTGPLSPHRQPLCLSVPYGH